MNPRIPQQIFGLEAAAFDPDAVAPATQRANAELIALLKSKPALTSGKPASHRAAEHAGDSLFAARVATSKASTRTIAGPGGELPLRIFRGSECHGVYLHFHGGGWVLGGAAMQDEQLQQLADHAGIAVVSVEYRLAPEHPYPAAPDDCEAAALWLISVCKAEFGTSTIIAGGESAGANLALVTALRLRDKHGTAGFTALNLVSGMYDLTLTPGTRQARPDRDLTPDDIRWFVNHYVPPESRSNPDVSPLLADLQGLPPALITVGSLDMLCDDSSFLYGRLLAAGNQAQIAVWPGGLHAFASIPSALATLTQQHQADYVRGQQVANSRESASHRDLSD